MSCLTPERRVAAKEGCSGLDIKKYKCKMKYSSELAEANTILCLEIFYAEAKRISLRHTFGYGKQLIPDPLVIGTH